MESLVAAALDAVRPARIEPLLQDLVAVPSVTGSAAESEAQHLLARRMEALGLDTDLWQIDLPALIADPDFPGSEAARDEAWGLVGTWQGTDPDGPTLVLNGHIDVVPLGDVDAWTHGPWSGDVADGRVFGRGACDMKGGLACQLLAVQVLREAGARLRGSVQLQSVVSEEDGGLGTLATIRRGHRGDYAVIGEPTGTDLVTACAGALTFRLTVPGLSAHGGVRRDGVDAIEKYLLVHAALRDLEARRNEHPEPRLPGSELPYPIAVGTVRAGDWASTVADRLVAEGRLGVALGEPVSAARVDLEEAVADVCAADPWLREHPVRVDWFGGQFASGMLPDGDPLEAMVRRAHEQVTGRAPAVRGAPYGSDLRLLTDLSGTPTLLYGPGDIRDAHQPDESVPIEELVTVTRTLVMLVARTCGVA